MSLRSAAEAALHVLESMVGKCDGSHIVRGRVLDKMCARCELRAALSAPDELNAREVLELALGELIEMQKQIDNLQGTEPHINIAATAIEDFLKRTEGQK